MPSQAEIEAAAKAIAGPFKVHRQDYEEAERALTAAERVREETRTQPCENCDGKGVGGTGRPVSLNCRACKGTGKSPETAPPIPDEAVEAAEDYLFGPDVSRQMKKRLTFTGTTETVEQILRTAAPIIRQQALAEAKARVEGLRSDWSPGHIRSRTEVRTWNRAIAAALTAIDGSDDE